MCAAGAIVDLQNGAVSPPPLGGTGYRLAALDSCAATFDDTGYEYRRDSSLMIVRCGCNYDASGKNRPDIYYLLWEGNGFKELLHIRAKKR